MFVRNSQGRNPELKAGCEPWCPSLKHPQKSCPSSTHQRVCNTAWQISFDSVKFAKQTPTKQGHKMKVVQIECDDSKPSGFPGLAGWKLTETAVSMADIWCQYLEKSLCLTQSPLLHSPSHTRPEEFTQNDLTSSLGHLPAHKGNSIGLHKPPEWRRPRDPGPLRYIEGSTSRLLPGALMTLVLC